MLTTTRGIPNSMRGKIVEPLSNYTIAERPRSFLIGAGLRDLVCVEQTETGFLVRTPAEVQLTLFDLSSEDDLEPEDDSTAIGFFEYQVLVKQIVALLFADWVKRNGEGVARSQRQRMRAKIRKSVEKRVREQRNRLLSLADPDVLAFQRAVFAAGGLHTPLLQVRELYEYKYLVSDVKAYRAAAAVVAVAEELCDLRPEDFLPAAKSQWDFEHGMSMAPTASVIRRRERLAEAARLRHIVEQLSSWQDLCSPTGRAYRSLRRTLMNLPGGIPSRLLCALKQVPLERAITNRLELLTFLIAANDYANGGIKRESALRILGHAEEKEIQEAITLVSAVMADPISFRRAKDVERFVAYLLDYPREHRGRLVGLARQAIRWHQETYWKESTKIKNMVDPDLATKVPPIPLPDIDGVQFLSDVEQIYIESEKMDHCIGYYARRAVTGESFLFHVERRGVEASVEVTADGRVRQASGRYDESNEASRWGCRVLTEWGGGLADYRERAVLTSRVGSRQV